MNLLSPLGVFLLVSLALGTYATLCTPPISPRQCAAIRVMCMEINERICRKKGGEYLPNGGFCGYCDLCAEYVGLGATCNTTMPGEYKTAVCEPPLICSERSSGICVDECTEYN